MTLEWELPSDLSAAGAARAHVRTALESPSASDELIDDAVLVASELAANAIRHGSPPVSLLLDVEPGLVRITVRNRDDGSDPHILEADDDAHHGRGLAIAAALASDIGWTRHGDRLDVWAVLPTA